MAEAVPDDSASARGGMMPPELEGVEGLSVPVGEGGGALSPLSGAYLLVVLSEPLSEAHKTRMVQKLRQGNHNSIGKHFCRLLPKTAETITALE